MAEQEEDYSSLPITERATHKIWKVRQAAYIDAAAQFARSADESDPCFTPWLQDAGIWKGIVGDSNVAAQQEGVTALCSFLEFGGRSACVRTRQHAIPPMAEKCLSSTRPATKNKSLEAILLYVELDSAGLVLEELIPVLLHKLAKVVASVAAALVAIYHAYGARTVDPKPTLKLLPKLFAHADKNVRAEATKLVVELYRWLGEAMKPMFWGELKPVQQKELEDLFEKLKGEPAPKQERLLRSQKAAAAAAAAAGEPENADDDGEDGSGAAEVDAFDLAEPVNVYAKIPKELHEKLGSVKWKDRKDALDALYAALNVPRIKDDEFRDIVAALAKCMKDANIVVVTVAANCIDALATGIRKSFGKYKATVLPPMFERLKEKKQSVTDALSQALDAVFNSTSFPDILEDTLSFLVHKNPQVKLESLKFLIRCLRNTRTPPSKAEQKQVSDACQKLLADTSADIRSGAAEAMGTLMKIIGERAMNPYTEGLDEIRKVKIKEFFETAEVKSKERPPAPRAVKAPPPKKGPPGKGGINKPGIKKSAPAALPSPTEDFTPLPPKPTTRGIPGPGGSKLAAPRSLGAPTAGSKLQRKSPTGIVATPSGNSPSAGRPGINTVHSIDDDAPQAIAPPSSKFGLGIQRPPVHRPLQAPQALTQNRVPAVSSSVVEAGLAAIERAELEQLRAEVERMIRQLADEKSEKAKLQQEINDLQLANAKQIEEHTRDVLQIKAKETQLVRARSDADAAESQLQKVQRENDRLKRELSRTMRATSPAPTDITSEAGENYAYRDSVISPTGFPSRMGNKRQSYASTFSVEEKENGSVAGSTLGARSPTSIGGKSSPTLTGERGSGSIENWQRAAEVTSQLKARIEQMKARQNMRAAP